MDEPAEQRDEPETACPRCARLLGALREIANDVTPLQRSEMARLALQDDAEFVPR